MQTSRGLTLRPSRSFATTDPYCCTVTIIGSFGTITGRAGVTLQPTSFDPQCLGGEPTVASPCAEE